MRKVLCLLLALALGVALLPAAALPNPDNTAQFTRQPPKNLFVAYGETIILEIRAELPEESDGTPLRYQWYCVPDALPQPDLFAGYAVSGAQEARMTMQTGVLAVIPSIRPGSAVGNLYYRCLVTAALQDGTESVVASETCWVRLYYGWDSALAALGATRQNPTAFAGNLLGLLSTPFQIAWGWMK